jgi:hypothetical protein
MFVTMSHPGGNDFMSLAFPIHSEYPNRKLKFEFMTKDENGFTVLIKSNISPPSTCISIQWHQSSQLFGTALDRVKGLQGLPVSSEQSTMTIQPTGRVSVIDQGTLGPTFLAGHWRMKFN